jgi:hypothetical protein
MKRYFVAHANVRNATKPVPIAIQTQAGMAIPQSPIPLTNRSYWHFASDCSTVCSSCGFGFNKLWLSPQPKTGRIARAPAA